MSSRLLPHEQHAQSQASGTEKEATSPGQREETLSSLALLRGHSSIAIDHLGTRYFLRATRAGKLILTK